MNSFAPIVPPSVPCKVCGSSSGLYGVVDFNKNCLAGKNQFPLPPAGIPIYYHRCPGCRLIFTVAFDHFSKDDFLSHVYNEAYALVDPDYAELRPANTARMIEQAFGRTPTIRILDYGGGNGAVVAQIRRAGFVNSQTYDPFVEASATPPTGKFQLITCIEVAEHSNRPMETFGQMASLLDDEGMILFTTMTQPANIDQIGLGWWYAGPRNGHVTLYSHQALQHVADAIGMTYAPVNAGIHTLFRRDLPAFARHLAGR